MQIIPKMTDVMTARLTNKEGNVISYVLKIIQQPHRARACGFGPNSSADRRPVDPPPVVELRIYQHTSNNVPVEVTISYKANFFLYAQLETEDIPPSPATASTSQSSVNSLLTGVPVSGVSYLDRPERAGYFFFPDLSIKKDGSYRLHFHLYEEAQGPGSEPLSPSIIFRGSIRSSVFQVYSAKKFPGLMESTAISRTLADQGCRVRNRRGKTCDKANSRAAI